MMKSLEERKNEYLEFIYQQCKSEGRKYWQQNTQEYISLRHFSRKSKHYPDRFRELVIKFDFKRALLGSALFLFLYPGVAVLTGNEQSLRTPNSIFFISFIVVVTTYNCLKELSNPVKIKMDQSGIWLHNIDSWISWSSIIASYIRMDNSKEDGAYFLVMHYYDKEKDIFSMAEIDLGGLDLKKEDAVVEFEVRRIGTCFNSDKIYL